LIYINDIYIGDIYRANPGCSFIWCVVRAHVLRGSSGINAMLMFKAAKVILKSEASQEG